MLDQVIYTRCTPHRDLLKNGVVVRQDGYAVFSMSKTIFAPEKKIDLASLKRRLAIQNGAKENDPVGLFQSYEYTAASDGAYAITLETAREHCQIHRRNGMTHRPGNFIKQALVGQIKGYPCEFFGAGCWDAHLKSENDYYLDESPNAEPAWLPQVPETAKGGYVTMNRVRAFVSDGRAEAVKGSVWFLLREFDKPVTERRVLLIRDLPANVELWVAAIGYAFSAAMARKITFATNRTKLGGQTDAQLFYYTDAAGNYYLIRNSSIPMTRNPHYMIVGYHPQDKLCANLRQMPNSNYVILDGVARSLGIQPDEQIRAPYYQALVQYDADIEDFCSVLLPSLPLKEITSKLPDLFDAYKYLLDSNHKADKWAYTDALEYLRMLTQNGIPTNEALNQYLLEACISAYGRFSSQDETAKYPFLKIMWKLAGVLRREQDVSGCVADRLIETLNNLRDRGDMFRRSWNAIVVGGIITMLRTELRGMFADSELPRYLRQFGECDASSVSAVLDAYLTVLEGEHGGMDSLMTSRDRFEFIYKALALISGDRREVGNLLRRLSRSGNLLNAVAVAVSEELDRTAPRSTAAWWDAVIDVSGGNVTSLCRNLCSYKKAKIDLVERLLVNQINRSGACTREMIDIFQESIQNMKSNTGTGLKFFDAWIRQAELGDTSRIINSVRGMGLAETTEKKIFDLLDGSLPLEIIGKGNSVHLMTMEKWGREMNKKSRTVTFALFKDRLEKETKTERAIDLISEFALNNYEIDERLIHTDYFEDLVDAAGRLENEEVTMFMLCLFKYPTRDICYRYISEYVCISLNQFSGRSQLMQMVALTGAAIHKYTIRGVNVEEIQTILRDELVRQLPTHARNNMPDRILRMTDVEQDVKIALIRMLRCGESSGFLGGMFGGWNKSGGSEKPGGIGGFFSSFGRKE